MVTEAVNSKDVVENSAKSNGLDHEALLADKARVSAHQLVDQAADKAVGIESALRDKTGETGQALTNGKDRIEYKLKRQYVSTRKKAKENPLLTLGIVFAVGAVIGRSLKSS